MSTPALLLVIVGGVVLASGLCWAAVSAAHRIVRKRAPVHRPRPGGHAHDR